MQYNFDWNPRKAHANIYKHGVTFEEAVKVFDDPMALTVFDAEESNDDEDRWVTLGQINGQHIWLWYTPTATPITTACPFA